MKKKIIFIDQPRFLGDIIFVMAIAQKYAEEGYPVEFPVDDQYLNYGGIQKNFDLINLIPLSNLKKYSAFHNSKIIEDFDRHYLRLTDSTFYSVANRHMRYKYESLNLPYKMWRSIKINRDFVTESKLITLLEIKEEEKFNLINNFYSNKKIMNMKIKVNNNYKNVYMSKIDGFNIFDWMGVIERAESIHTVHTSLQYIIDIMPNITNQLHIYLRTGICEPHSYYDYLFEKKYIYHGYFLNRFFEIICYIRRIKNFLNRSSIKG